MKMIELRITKTRDATNGLKDLGAFDYSSITEGDSLYIQTVLANRFGKSLTINEFMFLCRYEKIPEAVASYLKYQCYYLCYSDSGRLVKNDSAFSTTLGMYDKNWKTIFEALVFLCCTVVFGVFGAALSSQDATTFLKFYSVLLSLLSIFSFCAAMFLGIKFGEPGRAIYTLTKLNQSSMVNFPLDAKGWLDKNEDK